MDKKLTNGLTRDMSLVMKHLVTYHEHRGESGDEAVRKAIASLEVNGLEYLGGIWKPTSERKADHAVITKSDTDKRLVFGWANVIATVDDTVVIDKEGDFIDDEWEIEKSAYQYMLDCRDGGAEHVMTGIGKAVESMVFTREKQQKMGIPEGILPVGWWIGFKVEDDMCWDLVKSGTFKGFSVHGKAKRSPVTKAK